MLDASKKRCLPLGIIDVEIVLRGAGAGNAPTVVQGPNGVVGGSLTAAASGITVTRAGLGDFSVVFKEAPGQSLVGWNWGHGHTAPTAATSRVVQVDSDSYTAAGKAVRFTVSDTATPTLQDLGVNETVCLTLKFRHVGPGI